MNKQEGSDLAAAPIVNNQRVNVNFASLCHKYTINMKTSVNMSDDLAKNIYDTYTSDSIDKGEAFTRVCEGYMHLRLISLASLRGKLTTNELTLIVDNLNGTLVDTSMKANTAVLAAHIEDGDLYEGLGEKYKVNVAELSEKVKTLTPAQVFFLTDEIQRWWDKQFCTLEEFVRKFE